MQVQWNSTKNPWKAPFRGLEMGEAFLPLPMEKTGKSHSIPQQANGLDSKKSSPKHKQLFMLYLYIYILEKENSRIKWWWLWIAKADWLPFNKSWREYQALFQNADHLTNFCPQFWNLTLHFQENMKTHTIFCYTYKGEK